MGTRLLAAFGLAASLGACGDDSTPGDTTQPDADTTPDTDPRHDAGHDARHDAGHHPRHDAGHHPGHDAGHHPRHDAGHHPGHRGRHADLATRATATTGEAFFTYSEDSGHTSFGLSNDTAAPDRVLRRWRGSPLTGRGDYELGDNADDQNYGTCSTCALLTIGEQAFFATSGTITVTEVDQVGEVLQAELKDATFIEVEIPGIAEQDYTSVPVPNGETRCLASSSLEIACLADATDFACDSALCGPRRHRRELGCVDSASTVCTGDDAIENDDDGP